MLAKSDMSDASSMDYKLGESKRNSVHRVV